MKVLLVVAYLLLCVLIVVFVPPIVAPFDYGNFSMFDAGQAVLLWLILGLIVGYFVCFNKENRSFLLQLFGWGLLVRILVSTGIFIFNVQEFFGGDALTYDFYGYAQLKAWQHSFGRSRRWHGASANRQPRRQPALLAAHSRV